MDIRTILYPWLLQYIAHRSEDLENHHFEDVSLEEADSRLWEGLIIKIKPLLWIYHNRVQEKNRRKVLLESHFLFLCTVKSILDDVDNKIWASIVLPTKTRPRAASLVICRYYDDLVWNRVSAMWLLGHSQQPFSCVLGHFCHCENWTHKQTNNRVIVEQSCSWKLRRQTFAISINSGGQQHDAKS